MLSFGIKYSMHERICDVNMCHAITYVSHKLVQLYLIPTYNILMLHFTSKFDETNLALLSVSKIRFQDKSVLGYFSGQQIVAKSSHRCEFFGPLLSMTNR